jgi:hypothetical protein
LFHAADDGEKIGFDLRARQGFRQIFLDAEALGDAAVEIEILDFADGQNDGAGLHGVGQLGHGADGLVLAGEVDQDDLRRCYGAEAGQGAAETGDVDGACKHLPQHRGGCFVPGETDESLALALP